MGSEQEGGLRGRGHTYTYRDPCCDGRNHHNVGITLQLKIKNVRGLLTKKAEHQRSHESYAPTSRWEDNGVKKEKEEAEFNSLNGRRKRKIHETFSTKSVEEKNKLNGGYCKNINYQN